MHSYRWIAHSQLDKRSGFTIVELLVVVGVLGILAGIVAFSMTNWRVQAAETEAKSDLVNVVAAMRNQSNFSSSGFPVLAAGSTFGAAGDAANRAIFQASKDVTLTYVSGNSSSFCVEATSTLSSSVRFFAKQDGIVTKGTCAGGVTP